MKTLAWNCLNPIQNWMNQKSDPELERSQEDPENIQHKFCKDPVHFENKFGFHR